MSEMLEM